MRCEITQLEIRSCRHGGSHTVMYCRSCGELREVVPGQQCIGDNHWQLAEDYPPSNNVRGTIQCGDDCPAGNPTEQLVRISKLAAFLGAAVPTNELPPQLRAVHERQQAAVVGVVAIPQPTGSAGWRDEQGRYQVPLPSDLEFSVEE